VLQDGFSAFVCVQQILSC